MRTVDYQYPTASIGLLSKLTPFYFEDYQYTNVKGMEKRLPTLFDTASAKQTRKQSGKLASICRDLRTDDAVARGVRAEMVSARLRSFIVDLCKAWFMG